MDAFPGLKVGLPSWQAEQEPDPLLGIIKQLRQGLDKAILDAGLTHSDVDMATFKVATTHDGDRWVLTASVGRKVTP